MKENVAREAILAVVGVACAIVAGLGFACSGAFAQCRLAELEIPSPPGFGIDVAISNGRAAVSFPGDFVDVYRLDRSTWVHEARITGPADVRFGASVALFGSWLGVGAPGVDDGRGKVYLYEREGDRWLHRETLVSPRPITNRQFGLALEASENRIAILEVSGSALMDLHVFVRVTHDLWAFDSTIRRVPLRYGQPNGTISADGRSVAFARVWTIQGPYETRIYERQGESWIETTKTWPSRSRSTIGCERGISLRTTVRCDAATVR